MAFPGSLLVIALSLALTDDPTVLSPLTTSAERAALIHDAFDSAYGKALTAELGRSLRRDADPACLQAKGLRAGQLEDRGRDLMVKWGTSFGERAVAFIDMKAYSERFSNTDELKQLEQDADVKRYLAMSVPARQARLLDSIVENFARYVLISRIKLGFAPPQATGNAELLSKNPIEATEDALGKFAEERKSATLDRFLDLSEQSAAALEASFDKQRAMKTAPHDFFRGVETDLAEICIGHRS